MNERIKELMKQCETEYSTSYEPCYDMEKFAELLIRHCASQVRFTDLLLCNDDDDDGEILLQASVQLKRHFGVKE